ncbi:MAG: hypothetical protein HZB91_03980, partial [Elusimicrobia bacterium]|nr:hypothetical protein [Elusimicrobiota bacterium]
MAARLRPLSLLAASGLASWALVFSVQQAEAQAFTARRSQTHTLLADGSILVVGGISDEDEDSGDPGVLPVYLGAAAGGVQRLNENRGVIENVASMAVNRASHTATLLPDGRVLVVGGYSIGGAPGCGGACTSFTIYEPVYNNWIAAADLPVLGVLPGGARFNHTATLTKDGRVFICGGQNNAGAALSTCVIFTPGYGPRGALNAPGDAIAAGAVSENLLAARTNHTATLLFNGDILVTGGYNPALAVDGSGANAWSLRYLNTSERFTTDPAFCAT